MDLDAAAWLAAVLATRWGSPPWTEAQISDFAHDVQDLADPNVAALAVLDLIRGGIGHRPTPADVRLGYVERMCEQLGTPLLGFDRAWGIVLKLLARPQLYEHVARRFPLVHAVLDDFGWMQLRRSDRVDVVRAQFRAAYEARRARELRTSMRRGSPTADLCPLRQLPPPGATIGLSDATRKLLL